MRGLKYEKKNGDRIITNELYRSEKSNVVGINVPLNQLYENLEPTAAVEDLSTPTFTYARPSGFNNINPTSPLGLGICDNAKMSSKQIDDTYDSFNWEIKIGERKIAIPESMTNVLPDESGNLRQVFDDTTNIFLAVPMDRESEKPIDLTIDIRAKSYIDSINFFLRIWEFKVKLSPGTFTFDGKSVKTATEVISEDSQTYKTRNKHITHIEEMIKHLIISTLEIASRTTGPDGVLYSGTIPTEDEIGIDFDDGVFQSKEALIKQYSNAILNKSMPRIKALQRMWDIPEDEAAEWLQMIAEEEKLFSPEYEHIRSEIELGAGSEI